MSLETKFNKCFFFPVIVKVDNLLKYLDFLSDLLTIILDIYFRKFDEINSISTLAKNLIKLFLKHPY